MNNLLLLLYCYNLCNGAINHILMKSGRDPMCAAPRLSTVADLWHMIWQENCNTIVMLTLLIENGKVNNVTLIC
jgi:protein tyrosine phosphatase